MNLLPDDIAARPSDVAQARRKGKARAKAREAEATIIADPTTTLGSGTAYCTRTALGVVDRSSSDVLSQSGSAEVESPFSSSDFEPISESEAPTAQEAAALSQQPSTSRSLRASSRGRFFSLEHGRSPPVTRDHRAFFTLSPERDVEGDDEESAVEGEEEARGRARTRERRRREDDAAAASRGGVEDALRSSLALLMAMSPVPQSLSPAVSQVNMQSLVARSPTKTPESPAKIDAFKRMHAYAPARPSPFASALTSALANTSIVAEDLETPVAEVDNVFDATFDSSSDEGTELGPRGPYGEPKSRPLPIPRQSHRGRSHSDTTRSPPAVSPLVQSRNLPLQPSSASPPTWSRKRLRRGKPRRDSVSPGPATVEERRRARSQLRDSLTTSTLLVNSDDAPPALPSQATLARAQQQTGKMSFSSLGLEGPSLLDDRWRNDGDADHDVSTPASSEEASSLPSDEPRLASSVPTLELSSGPECDQASRERRSQARETGAVGAETRSSSSSVHRTSKDPTKAADHTAADASPSWFSRAYWSGWLGSFEVKVWHVVGLAGVLLGVGMAATPIVKAGKAWAAKSGWTSFSFQVK